MHEIGLPTPQHEAGRPLTWNLRDQELSAVTLLPASERYAYLVKRVADWEEVWGLWGGDGWALMSDDAGRVCLAIWPHPRFAELCARDEWLEYAPKAVELDRWLKAWLPGLMRDGRYVAVFPTLHDRAVVVEPSKLHLDLDSELALIED